MRMLSTGEEYSNSDYSTWMTDCSEKCEDDLLITDSNSSFCTNCCMAGISDGDGGAGVDTGAGVEQPQVWTRTSSPTYSTPSGTSVACPTDPFDCQSFCTDGNHATNNNKCMGTPDACCSLGPPPPPPLDISGGQSGGHSSSGGH
tara:strand:- start:110 stop:544 length:435 start_codon:yes stop_codon:yes gene_type:complete